MDFTHLLNQMLIIFGVVLVGYFATKMRVWTIDMNRKMSVFVLQVSAPMLILSSVMGEGMQFSRKEIACLMLVAVVKYAVLIAATYLITALWHVDPDRKGQLRFMTSFGNVTFIGFPVVDAVFGARALFYAAVLTIPFNVLMFTIGVMFVTGEGRFKAAFRPGLIFSPCVVAALITVVMAFFKVDTPEPVCKFFHLVGDMTIPIALLIIGSTLSTMPKRQMLGSRFVYTAAAARLLLMPVLVMCVLRVLPLGADETTIGVAVLLAGMPVAANGVMFCLRYGCDERLMAQTIFFSTFLSVVTIPLVAMWL